MEKILIRQLVKYAITGMLTATISVVLMYLLVDKLELFHLLAAPFTFLFAACLAFVIDKHWTFEDKQDSKRQYYRFASVYAGGAVINLILIAIFINLFHIYYLSAQAMATPAAGFACFLLNRKYTFKSG